MSAKIRDIVVPGDLLDDSGKLKPGANTYRDGDAIVALRLGVKSVRGDEVNVISLSGRYVAERGDFVIGTVVETGPSNWYIDVGAAHDAGMHVNDVPWRVEFGETGKYLAVGETALLKVHNVDDVGKVQVSMKDRQCRKLTGGLIVEVAPTKVPRIIGRGGSMIQMVKDMTNVRLFVGQNGVIWMDGEPQDLDLALAAIRKIENESHKHGLTDEVRGLLEERTGRKYEDVQRELADLEDEGDFEDEGEDEDADEGDEQDEDEDAGEEDEEEGEAGENGRRRGGNSDRRRRGRRGGRGRRRGGRSNKGA